MDDSVQMKKRCASLCESVVSEDGRLKYDLMISLHKAAMAKIITTLWINGGTRQFFEQYKSVNRMHFIKNEISALHLPSPFTGSLIKVFKSVGQSVVDWLDHHSDMFDSYGVAFRHINNIKWNSRARIDYAQTAKNILANMDNCLSDELKFRLACSYCLEHEIAALAPKVVDRDYMACVDESRYPMLHFWTTQSATSEFSIASLFDSLCSCRYNDVRFQCEVSVTWTWNRLSAEEKSERFASLIVTLLGKDASYSLLSTGNHEQQQFIFRKVSFWILRNMLDDWLWEDYFLPTALHVLNIMKPNHRINILRIILVKIGDSQEEERGLGDQYKPMFKLLWREAPLNMKEIFLESGCIPNSLLGFSTWVHVDLIESVLNDFNSEQKKAFILGDWFYLSCTIGIYGIEVADFLMKWCEATSEEISCFKIELFSEHIHHRYCRSFWPLLIKWCNPSDETIKQVFGEDWHIRSLLHEFIENRS